MRRNPNIDISINQPVVYETQEWEHAIKSHKKFMRVTEENRGLFFVLLGKENDLDSYLTSPVYYALTGRKGLWLYQDGNTYMPVCWHPNVEGQILIFPPRGKENPDILRRLLMEIPIPPHGIRLVRIKKPDKSLPWHTNLSGSSERTIIPTPVQENVLDWLYPVRILSSEKVMNMQGHEYMRVRNYINQAKRHGIITERLMPSHKSQVLNFSYRWANKRAEDLGDLIDLIDPYKEILNLLDDESFNLDGLVFYIDGSLQGVTVWEKPNNLSGIANSWVNLGNVAYRGISEFMMKSVAETLHTEGVQYFNLGGSETKSLDDYKRKYVPVQSIELKSIEIILDGSDFVLDSLFNFHTSKVAACL